MQRNKVKPNKLSKGCIGGWRQLGPISTFTVELQPNDLCTENFFFNLAMVMATMLVFKIFLKMPKPRNLWTNFLLNKFVTFL